MSDSNPQQGSTIEDKLKDIVLMSKYLRGRKPNPLRLKSFPNAIKELQAIITTETTKARIDEIKWMQKQIPKKVKGVNYGTPENNPHGWAYETYIEAWKPVLKARLDALQKEQKQ